MKPKRIQRQRTKGWRMPENTVYVGRTAKVGCHYGPRAVGNFANPYYVGMFRDYMRADAVADYKRWIDGDVGARVLAGPPPTKEEIRADLRGKNLACWCPPGEPCHADVLLEIANADA